MVVALTLFLWSWLPVKSTSPIIAEQPVVDHEAELRAYISDIAESIYEAEGRCDYLHGQSGEYGCFQYQSGTWRNYSTIVLGEVVPQTPENERLVTEGMIRLWLADGKTPRWIFLTWNQGNGDGWGPGSKDCYAGVNKHGVAYDSCDYAARALNYLAEKQKEPATSSI